MLEVMNPHDANFVAIFSEAYGRKRVIAKIYFNLPDESHYGEMMLEVASNYGYLAEPNVRLEFARYKSATIVGGW